MAERGGIKRDEEQSQSESESEVVEDDNGDDDDVEIDDSSTSCGDGDENESDDDEDFDKDEAESVRVRVVRLLGEGSDLQENLSLTECKTYLREHGLRLSGTKADCIQRIIEHWRIKDRNGEALYPRSSFSINCTGDVCKGDVVLFTQKVYEKGSPLGKRTIAGRVVKESYGAAKQQHTFTVAVLWSKGFKILPPLFPLLVKGRNLYKLKTFRQRWMNEAERSNVLTEKHKRGAAARLTRAMTKRKMTFSTHAVLIIISCKPSKKHDHRSPFQTKQKINLDKGKCVNMRKNTPTRHVKNSRHQKPRQVGQGNSNFYQTTNSRAYAGHQNFSYPNGIKDSRIQSYSNPTQPPRHYGTEFHNQRVPLGFHSSGASFTSASCSTSASMMMSAAERREYNYCAYPHHVYPRPTYEHESRYVYHFPGLADSHRPVYPPPLIPETYRQRRYGF